MKITKRQLKRIIRECILEESYYGDYSSRTSPEYDKDGYLTVFTNRAPPGITSMAGMDRHGDHRGVLAVMKEASDLDRDVERFFKSAAENCERLLDSVADRRMDLEELAYEAGDGSEAHTAYVQYMDQEEDSLRAQWNDSYMDHCSNTDVFSVPPRYYELIFDLMYHDNMSAPKLKMKISYGY